MFHKLKKIQTRDNYIIEAEFQNGIKKIYDLKPILKKIEIFKKLKNKNLYNSAKIDIGGLGIIWNDEIDLSSEEIWNNGITLKI